MFESVYVETLLAQLVRDVVPGVGVRKPRHVTVWGIWKWEMLEFEGTAPKKQRLCQGGMVVILEDEILE